ncbi:hypothetical protein M407DRAFT_241172, partial [Tulasnella calospora MUT 4182]
MTVERSARNYYSESKDGETRQRTLIVSHGTNEVSVELQGNAKKLSGTENGCTRPVDLQCIDPLFDSQTTSQREQAERDGFSDGGS